MMKSKKKKNWRWWQQRRQRKRMPWEAVSVKMHKNIILLGVLLEDKLSKLLSLRFRTTLRVTTIGGAPRPHTTNPTNGGGAGPTHHHAAAKSFLSPTWDAHPSPHVSLPSLIPAHFPLLRLVRPNLGLPHCLFPFFLPPPETICEPCEVVLTSFCASGDCEWPARDFNLASFGPVDSKYINGKKEKKRKS